MKCNIEFSEDTIDKITDKVIAKLAKKKKEAPPKREVIIPTVKNFQYTVKEISAMTKSSEGTVTRHIRNKVLIATKVGKSWKITHENYLKYIENENK
jgi:excisionase family DNA binding protein